MTRYVGIRDGRLVFKERSAEEQAARVAEAARLRAIPPRVLSVTFEWSEQAARVHRNMFGPSQFEFLCAICSVGLLGAACDTTANWLLELDRVSITVSISVRGDLAPDARLDRIREMPTVLSAKWENER